MIDRFKVNHYYKYIGGIHLPGFWNSIPGYMDFMLDGKFHRCREVKSNEDTTSKLYASFYDSGSSRLWFWGSFESFIERSASIEMLKEILD